MNRVLAFLSSSIGKKVVMAVTGAMLLAFVFVHMLGNLQVYLGPTKLDEYGAALRKFPPLLWGARLALLLAAGLHIWGALSTTLESWRARPVEYKGWRPAGDASTLSSRTMRWTGLIILAFVVYHLLHLTLGLVHPDFVEGAVNHNFVRGFQVLGASAAYVAAMLALGLHMYHGGWSLFQTLGISHPRYNHLRFVFATILAIVVVLANVSFPFSVLAGLVKEAPQAAAAWLGR